MTDFITKKLSSKFVKKQLFDKYIKQDIKEYWKSIENTKIIIIDTDYLFNLIRAQTSPGLLSINVLYKGVLKFTKSLLSTRPNLEKIFFCCHVISEDSIPFQQTHKPYSFQTSSSPSSISPLFLNGDDISPLAVNLHDPFAQEDHSYTILNDANYKPFIYSRVFDKLFKWLESEQATPPPLPPSSSFMIHVCFPLSDVFVSGNSQNARLSINTLVIRREKKKGEEKEQIITIKTTCVDSFMNNKSRPFMQAKFLIEMSRPLKNKIEWHSDWKHDIDVWASALFLFDNDDDDDQIGLYYFGYRFKTLVKEDDDDMITKIIRWMGRAISFRSQYTKENEDYENIIGDGDDLEDEDFGVTFLDQSKKRGGDNAYIFNRILIGKDILFAGVNFLFNKYHLVNVNKENVIGDMLALIEHICYPNMVLLELCPDKVFSGFNDNSMDITTSKFIETPFSVDKGFKIVDDEEERNWVNNRYKEFIEVNLRELKKCMRGGDDSFVIKTLQICRCLMPPFLLSSLNLIVWIIIQWVGNWNVDKNESNMILKGAGMLVFGNKSDDDLSLFTLDPFLPFISDYNNDNNWNEIDFLVKSHLSTISSSLNIERETKCLKRLLMMLPFYFNVTSSSPYPLRHIEKHGLNSKLMEIKDDAELLKIACKILSDKNDNTDIYRNTVYLTTLHQTINDSSIIYLDKIDSDEFQFNFHPSTSFSSVPSPPPPSPPPFDPGKLKSNLIDLGIGYVKYMLDEDRIEREKREEEERIERERIEEEERRERERIEEAERIERERREEERKERERIERERRETREREKQARVERKQKEKENKAERVERAILREAEREAERERIRLEAERLREEEEEKVRKEEEKRLREERKKQEDEEFENRLKRLREEEQERLIQAEKEENERIRKEMEKQAEDKEMEERYRILQEQKEKRDKEERERKEKGKGGGLWGYFGYSSGIIIDEDKTGGLDETVREGIKYILRVPKTRRLFLLSKLDEETRTPIVDNVYKEILSGERNRIVSGEYMQSLGEIWNSEYHTTNTKKITPIEINISRETKNIISFFPETVEFILPLINHEIGISNQKAITWHKVFDQSFITFLEFHLFMRNDKDNIWVDSDGNDRIFNVRKISKTSHIYQSEKKYHCWVYAFLDHYKRLMSTQMKPEREKEGEKEQENIIKNMLDLASLFPLSHEILGSISHLRKEICIWFDSGKMNGKFLDLYVQKYIRFFIDTIKNKIIDTKTNYNAIFTMKNDKIDYKIAFYIF